MSRVFVGISVQYISLPLTLQRIQAVPGQDVELVWPIPGRAESGWKPYDFIVVYSRNRIEADGVTV